MSARRFTNILFVLLFAGMAIFATAFLYRDYQHLDTLRAENTVLNKRSEGLREEAAKREVQFGKLNGDSEYIEAVIREKLNYAKEGEVVFRFER